MGLWPMNIFLYFMMLRKSHAIVQLALTRLKRPPGIFDPLLYTQHLRSHKRARSIRRRTVEYRPALLVTMRP